MSPERREYYRQLFAIADQMYADEHEFLEESINDCQHIRSRQILLGVMVANDIATGAYHAATGMPIEDEEE